MKSNNCKFIILLGIILFFTGVKPTFAETVRVGIYDFDPLCRTANPDTDGGIFLELINQMAVKEGWKLEYIPGTLVTSLERLRSGEIDVLAAASFSQDLADQFDFSQETVISTWAQLYTFEKSGIQSLLDLNERSIGIVRDDPYNQEMRIIMKKFNFSCRFVEFNTSAELLMAVERKWIEAGVVDRLYAISHEKEYRLEKPPIIFSPIELRFAVSRDHNKKLSSTIDYYLAEMKRDPRSIYHQLLKDTFSSDEDLAIIRYMKLGLIALVGLLLLTGGFSFFLRVQIRNRTLELYNQNITLEQEIERRGNAEKALRDSNHLLEKMFNSIRDVLFLLDNSGNQILNCNPAVLEMFGYCSDDLISRSPGILIPDEKQFENFKTVIPVSYREKGFWSGEIKLARKNGLLFPAELFVTPLLDDNGEFMSWMVIVRDITMRVQFRQAQKMEAIGTLAGGIAHDFNNILTPIIGYSEMLAEIYKHKYPLEDNLKRILQAALRAKDLVKQILTFSRQNEQEHRAFHISTVVKEVMKLLRASLPSTINIELNINTKDDVISADPVQIHQVMMNLCTNAAHAMQDTGGILEVTLADFEGPISGYSDVSSLELGSYLCLSVRDTGPGIEPVYLHRIFDPFFTTKKPGEGTGMGLSVVHGIVKSYSGAVSVETEKGAGTVFHVYLPKSVERVIITEQTVLPTASIRSETIMLVDDEQVIVEMVSDMLQGLGYKIVTCTNGAEALNLFEKKTGKVDLVITDQTMPGMTGAEMAIQMLKIQPDIPIILCTGYSETVSAERAKEIGIREFLLKPFKLNELGVLVRNVLDSQHSRIRERHQTVDAA